MPRKYLFLSTAACLAISPLLIATTAASAGIGHSAGLGTASLKGRVLVSGRVVTSGGDAVSGAQLRLYAWPEQKANAALRPGQHVPLIEVGSAVSSASGAYALPLKSPRALIATASPQGIVNLEVWASAGTSGAGTFSFPRQLVRTSHGMRILALFDSSPKHATVSLQAATIILGAGRDVSVRSAAIPGVCIPRLILVATYPAAPAVVGASYSRVKGVRQWFSYSQSQSTSVGVGISADGGAGSFTASGTFSVSSTSGEDWGQAKSPVSLDYKTDFVPALYKWTCGGDFQSQPSAWAGGATKSRSEPPGATFCVPQGANTTFHKDTSQAFVFSTGFHIAALNFDASTQTGYDTDAVIYYHYNLAGQLCGANGYPGGTPKRIVAGKRGS